MAVFQSVLTGVLGCRQAAVPANWHVFVRCGQCDRADFSTAEQLITHMTSHRGQRALDPAVYPPHIVCFKNVFCNRCGVSRLDHRTDLDFSFHLRSQPPCHHGNMQPLPCFSCKQAFDSVEDLAQHLRESEGGVCKKLPPEPEENTEAEDANHQVRRGLCSLS